MDTRPMHHPNSAGAPEAVMFHAWRTVDGVDEYCEDSEGPDGWCVYTRHENDAAGGFDCSEEMDFPTREDAEREASRRAARLGVDACEY